MTRTIGFKGQKGEGKSTAALALENAGFTHINFADRMKAACGIIFGLTHDEMYDAVLKETPLDRWPFVTPRKIMQDVGMAMRAAYPGVWVKGWQADAAAVESGDVVCSDLRFADEQAGMLEFNPGTKVAEIIDPRKPRTSDTHISESGIAEVISDVTITNDACINTLHARVAYIFLSEEYE